MTREPIYFPPYEPMAIVDVLCDCFRKNCRHKREMAAAAERQEQFDALTRADVDWLREMGWDR